MKLIVNCPDSRRLSDLLDGMASDADQAELTRHLDDCPRCQQRLETLAVGDSMPADVARLGRWRREAGPALAHVMTVLTENRDLDTVTDDEVILEFLAPSDRCGSLGRFGDFEILELLGHGGMGIVLKALDTELNRIVALKVLAPQLAASSSARKRFAREARAAAAITHSNVVSIHAVDIERGLPYLVMEYVPGESLQQCLDRDSPLPIEEILQLAIQIADGLAAAHERGIVHRDLKPGNVLLAACGLAEDPKPQAAILKLTDFGLARSFDDGTVTQSGFLPGTPAYMAPEQARGERADTRSDLFSLGSVMYAMCTGRPPFHASTMFALLRRVSEDEPLAVQSINPLVPQWLGEIMKKLHAKDPERRFQTASETATILRECLAHVRQPDQAPLPWFLRPLSERKRPRRNRAVAGILALIALIGVGLTAAGVFRVKTSEGTLIIDVSDPKVNVTVDGKDITISGEGIAELRLRTGQYRLEASKDGKPILTRLVDIKKDGKEVVRVSLEPPAQAAATTVAPLNLSGHKGAVQAVAFSPDGKLLVSAGKDQAVRIWDAATGKQVFIRDKAGPVLAISFFPDGKVLVTIAADGTVQLWDVATGKVLTSVKLPGTIKLSAIDLNSKTIVSSSDGRIKLWDLASGKERVSLPYDEMVRALALSPDARSLAVAGKDGVTLWDAASGKILARVHHDPVIRSLAFSPDGKRLIVSSDEVRVWEPATALIVRQALKTTPATATAQSPDGLSVATGDAEGLVAVVSLGTGEVLFSHREKAGPITVIAFSPDGKRLAWSTVGSSRVDLQACKLEYSIVSPK